MELVYLWIQDYKNIKNTGFSLNPKYEIIYNQTQNVITCHCKHNYNVFGQNNIMTVIGQNGSGKSTLIKALLYILRNNEECDNENTNDYISCKYPPKSFIILKNADKYILKSNISDINSITIKVDDTEYILKNSKKFNCDIALFQPFFEKEDDEPLEFPMDQENDVIINIKLKNYFYYDRFRTYEVTHGLDLILKQSNLKLLQENPNLQFNRYGYEINIEFMFKWLNRQLKRIINNYYRPNNWTLGELWKFTDGLIDGNQILIQKWMKDKSITFFCDKILPRFCALYFIIQIGIFYYEIYEEDKTKDTNKILSIDLLCNIANALSIMNNCLSEEDLEKSHNDLVECYKKCLSELQNSFYKKHEFVSYLVNLLNLYIEITADNSSLLENLNENFILETKLNLIRLKTSKMLELNQNIIKESFIEQLKNTGIFRLNFYNLEKQQKSDDNRRCYGFFDLSAGEQRILKLYSDFIKLILEKKISFFVFDEPDLSWHPEWQRKMVYYITDIFEKLNLNRTINVIFTTHSPFILSDMPKDNVIMLYHGNDGYAKKCNIEKNTFGANIHDLFNNNFFFDGCDGVCTMGEFAKNHISNIHKLLITYQEVFNDPILMVPLTKSKDFDIVKKITNLEQKIQIIGEPIIKRTLLSKLYSNPIVQIYKNPEKLLIENFKLREQLRKLRSMLNEET